MAELCTREEIIKFVGGVCYQLAAPNVAKSALAAGAKAAGWEGVEDIISQAAPAQGKQQPKGKKGDKKGDDTDGQGKEKGDKKPRKMTQMNLFTNILLDMISKDPHNPAYKMPTSIDAEGKTVPTRGGHMTFVAACWKALNEQDKAKFQEIVQPLLDTVNENIASTGKRPENLHTEVQAHLSKTHSERTMTDLVNRSVLSHTGINPGKPGAHLSLTPNKSAGSDAKGLNNGDTDKKRKKAADDKEAKKTKHDDKGKDKGKDKKKKKKDEKKASSSSSSSSSSSDDSSDSD